MTDPQQFWGALNALLVACSVAGWIVLAADSVTRTPLRRALIVLALVVVVMGLGVADALAGTFWTDLVASDICDGHVGWWGIFVGCGW